MRRRDFIIGLGGSVAVWPLEAHAQQPPMPVIGYLNGGYADRSRYEAIFLRGLQDAGFVLGQNVLIEYRWGEGQFDRYPALVEELISRRVNLIVAVGGSSTAIAARSVTSTIPIVFVNGSDPVAVGLVASLNRPGGNVTGVSFRTVEIVGKRLALLRELLPATRTFASLDDPGFPTSNGTRNETLAAGGALAREVVIVEARTANDFEAAVSAAAQRGAGAIFVHLSPLFTANCARLVQLATRLGMPAVFGNRECALAGGLMSYGTNLAAAYRLGGVYAGRILNGAKPADLPVEQSAHFEFVLNLKTAKAFGLTVPPLLRALADEVIE